MNEISAHVLFWLCAYVALGALVGHCFLSALRWNVALYSHGSISVAVLVHGLRLVALAAVLVVVARAGAGALLPALAGFQTVRMATLHREAIVEII
jgi:hypothetical protein